ncbi:MAG: SAM-dependent methyltransferase [Clostridium sp.]|nr:SAM-dependent methyltransferase [Clostridium sp.]
MEAALYLFPVTLGDTALDTVLPVYNNELILQIRHFFVEDVRSARRFLKKVSREVNIDDITFYPMGKHAATDEFARHLERIAKGIPMGVLSEAGCPAVADPGADVVAIAQRKGLRVIPLVGPSSMILAVMASGFNGQSFAFNGYLPIDPADRTKKIKQLEQRVYTEHQTQLFIETPYRNAKMVDELLRTCRPQTRLCVAAGITCPEEYIRTQTIQEWKRTSLPDLSKIPAIFLLYK